MPRHLLTFFLLLSPLLQADSPTRLVQSQPPLEKAWMKTPLQENHQIILTLTARDGSPVEWSFTTGTPIFTATMEEQGIHFSGTLESVTGNTAILIYSLTWETPVPCATNTLYKKSSLQGGVRIELGKGVVLFRAGKQRVQVSVLPLEPGTP